MLLTACALALGACSPDPMSGAPPVSATGAPIPLGHARYLTLETRDDVVVACIRAPVSGERGASDPRIETIVLAPTSAPAPRLEGDLRGATLVRTPVQTVATNAGSDEAFLAALGVKHRLVAVGGLVSYDDDIRRRAKAGEIGQVGYNWHSPPNLDVLIARKPDLFMMRLSDLAHAPVLSRARGLGLTVLPTFAEEEPSYLGRAEWIRFYGLLFDQSEEAERIFAEVESSVAALKAKVANLPRKPVLWAYPSGADRWVAVVRGPEASYLTDAGGLNLLAKAEDPERYAEETISSEALLPLAERAEIWINGDLHAAPPRNASIERGFRAWREGRLFGNTGRSKTAANAHDWYQTAYVRPDWVLADFVKALHPDLVPGPFRFLKPLAKGQYQ